MEPRPGESRGHGAITRALIGGVPASEIPRHGMDQSMQGPVLTVRGGNGSLQRNR